MEVWKADLREIVEIQLGMVGKTHGWMRSLQLHEDIGDRV